MSLSTHSIPQNTHACQYPDAQILSDGLRPELQRDAYQELTESQKGIPVPRYFVEHWMDLLQSREPRIIIAARQCAFVNQETESTIVDKAIYVKELSKWSGLDSHQISKAIAADDSYLPWFAYIQKKRVGRRSRDEWCVYVEIPLAPHHLVAISEFVTESAHKWQGQIDSLLDDLTEALPRLKKVTMERATEWSGGRKSLQDIVLNATGRKSLTQSQILRCAELEARVIKPGDAIVIRHYFIKAWAQDLPSPMFNSVLKARNADFRGTVQNPQIIAKYGAPTLLGEILGVDWRTVKNWQQLMLNGEQIGAFVSLKDVDEKTFELNINVLDPVHPTDMDQYAALLEAKVREASLENPAPQEDPLQQIMAAVAAGRLDIESAMDQLEQSGTLRTTKRYIENDKTVHEDEQNGTLRTTKRYIENDKTVHEDEQNGTLRTTKRYIENGKPVRCTFGINDSLSNSLESTDFNKPPQPLARAREETEPREKTEPPEEEEVFWESEDFIGWYPSEIKSFLVENGLPKKHVDTILETLTSQEACLHASAHILQAFKLQCEGRKINAPLFLAYKKITAGETPPRVAIQTAEIFPVNLYKYIKNEFSRTTRGEFPESVRKFMITLEEGGFREKLDNVDIVEEFSPEQIDGY